MAASALLLPVTRGGRWRQGVEPGIRAAIRRKWHTIHATPRPQIPAFLRTGITNAGSEGTHRVIKTTARNAYSFRNPGNQRFRTRCATTRRARGHLDARQFR